MAPGRDVTFGPFRLDAVNECLWRGAQAIPLRPKAFGVLQCLVERPGLLVTKEHLLDTVWPDTFVGDAVLKDSVRQLREALGDDPKTPTYIETAHRRGYRFVAPIEGAPQSGIAPEPPPPIEPVVEPPAHPFVLGRERPLARMRRLLGRALAGDRQVVFVTGEPGIGKTTLVETFLEGAGAAGDLLVARGECLEHYGSGEAYLPVFDGLTRLARGPEGTRVVDLLRRRAPTWHMQMPGLMLSAERGSWEQMARAATRERMLREMAEALEALAVETPVALVLEDLHWSDYSTLDLISYLARRRDPARLLVVGTYRPVEVILGDHPLKGVKRELAARRLCEEVPLEYLAEEDVARYLDARFPESALPSRLARLVHARTEGNPLFMVNAVEYLVDEGAIVEEDGRWRVPVAIDELELGVPDTVRHLIERQIERLSPDEQRVLEGASVVGLDPSALAIAAGLDADPAWVEERCEELVRRHQFLAPARLVELPNGVVTPRYRFLHALYVDVPSGRIPPTRRAQIDQRIGECGEAVYGERVGEIAVELAMHFEHGRDWPRATKYLLMSAENAASRSAHYEAVALARRGLAALRSLPDAPERTDRELDLRLILGASLMATRGFASSEVEEVFEAASRLIDDRTPTVKQFAVLWSLGLFRVFRADLGLARDTARRLLGLAERLGDPMLVMEAHRALGVCYVDLGELALGREHLERAVALYDPARRDAYTLLTAYDPKVVALCFSARAEWYAGEADRALASVLEALALARDLGHAPSLAVASNFAALVHQLRGEAPEAQERAEAGMSFTRDYELELWSAIGAMLRGWARVVQEGDSDGVDELRRGLAAYEATGARLWRTQFLGVLADALGRLGRTDEALSVVDAGLAAVEATGERHYEAELYRLRGALLPPGAEAETWTARAIETARSQGAVGWERKSVGRS